MKETLIFKIDRALDRGGRPVPFTLNSRAARLIDNIVVSMQTVPQDIKLRQIRYFLKADQAYGTAVAHGLGIDLTPEEMSPVTT